MKEEWDFANVNLKKSDVFLVSAGCSGQSKYTVASRFEPPRHRSAEFRFFSSLNFGGLRTYVMRTVNRVAQRCENLCPVKLKF
ncbi:DNA ligase [Dirofilaria immitis]